MKAQADVLTVRWQAGEEEIQRLRALREQIEQPKIDIAQAERQYNLNRAAECRYNWVNGLCGILCGTYGGRVQVTTTTPLGVAK